MASWIDVSASCPCRLPHIVVDERELGGHIDHAKYILKNMEASTRDHLPKSPTSRPCVPGHQDDITGHQAREIEEDDQTIENEDGTITVPIEYLTVTHPSEPGK